MAAEPFADLPPGDEPEGGPGLDALVELAAAGLAGGVETIEGIHRAIARKPFAALRWAPAVGAGAEPVRLLHDGITALVYGSLRGALALTGSAARLGGALAPAAERAPRPGSAGDLAVAALNGWAGDRLARAGSPLACRMTLRRDGRAVAPRRAALASAYPAASPRVAVFAHGLACNETLWGRRAGRPGGRRCVSYGTRLERELGYSALYVRYNTGLHIGENGRRLARLLECVVAEWPVPIEELVLVGHSMGGLVIRSATHYGAAMRWTDRARHVFCLGAPHRGAPLEKAANVAGWLLGLSEVTRPLAALLNGRSRGIKDLRFGTLRDETWEGADLDALLARHAGDVPLLAGATHYFIAATVTRDRRHPLGCAVGDLLVREASALGGAALRQVRFPLARRRHVGAVGHMALLNHPAVYDQMRRWLSRQAE